MSEPRELEKLLEKAESNLQISSITAHQAYYKHFRSHVGELINAVKKLQQEIAELKADKEAQFASYCKLDNINTKLNEENEKLRYEIDGCTAMFEQLQQENKIMRDALEFYADINNWDEIWVDSPDGNDDNSGDCSCRIDFEDVEIKTDDDGSIYYSCGGKRAREALAKVGK